MTLTGSLGRLDVSEGNALVSDSIPVDGALVGRDVDALGLGPLHEVPDGDAEDRSGEKECGGESFEPEQHCCWGPPLSFLQARFISAQSIGRILCRRRKEMAGKSFESFGE